MVGMPEASAGRDIEADDIGEVNIDAIDEPITGTDETSKAQEAVQLKI